MKNNVNLCNNGKDKLKVTPFKSRFGIQALRIKPSAGKVKLRGSVHSWVELQDVISAAWKII